MLCNRRQKRCAWDSVKYRSQLLQPWCADRLFSDKACLWWFSVSFHWLWCTLKLASGCNTFIRWRFLTGSYKRSCSSENCVFGIQEWKHFGRSGAYIQHDISLFHKEVYFFVVRKDLLLCWEQEFEAKSSPWGTWLGQLNTLETGLGLFVSTWLCLQATFVCLFLVPLMVAAGW